MTTSRRRSAPGWRPTRRAPGPCWPSTIGSVSSCPSPPTAAPTRSWHARWRCPLFAGGWTSPGPLSTQPLPESTMPFLDSPTRFLFFTGKGGVGKTALACASAIRLADQGKAVLLVSTDPASNLDEMLGVSLSGTPTAVPGVANLHALNIDPEEAAEGYRQRVIGPYLGVWSEQQITELREQLSGSCTNEIAAFDEFAALLSGEDGSTDFDHIIFDTAPTGHTLRLLSLPRAWTEFLESNSRGASCLGPHSALKMRQDRFAAALAALADPARTTISLVTRPDRAALREAARTSGELQLLGLTNQQLVVNGVFRATRREDAVALALEERGRAALADMPAELRRLT